MVPKRLIVCCIFFLHNPCAIASDTKGIFFSYFLLLLKCVGIFDAKRDFYIVKALKDFLCSYCTFVPLTKKNVYGELHLSQSDIWKKILNTKNVINKLFLVFLKNHFWRYSSEMNENWGQCSGKYILRNIIWN